MIINDPFFDNWLNTNNFTFIGGVLALYHHRQAILLPIEELPWKR